MIWGGQWCWWTLTRNACRYNGRFLLVPTPRGCMLCWFSMMSSLLSMGRLEEKIYKFLNKIKGMTSNSRYSRSYPGWQKTAATTIEWITASTKRELPFFWKVCNPCSFSEYFYHYYYIIIAWLRSRSCHLFVALFRFSRPYGSFLLGRHFIQRFRGAPLPPFSLQDFLGLFRNACTKFWLIFTRFSETFGFLPVWTHHLYQETHQRRITSIMSFLTEEGHASIKGVVMSGCFSSLKICWVLVILLLLRSST